MAAVDAPSTPPPELPGMCTGLEEGAGVGADAADEEEEVAFARLLSLLAFSSAWKSNSGSAVPRLDFLGSVCFPPPDIHCNRKRTIW